MKVYDVYYIFKDEEDQDVFDNHPIIQWLCDLKEDKYKPVDCKAVDCIDGVKGQDGVLFSFDTKKAATKFAKKFGIPVSSILCSVNPDFSNPWLPEGCNNFDDCYEIYGAVPGFR